MKAKPLWTAEDIATGIVGKGLRLRQALKLTPTQTVAEWVEMALLDLAHLKYFEGWYCFEMQRLTGKCPCPHCKGEKAYKQQTKGAKKDGVYS